MPLVSSGVDNGNLRELALQRMKDLGVKCRDVRNREVGIQEIHKGYIPHEVCENTCAVVLIIVKYKKSNLFCYLSL